MILAGGQRSSRPMNNFGALRLLFAVLVVLGHSFELIDGDRSREPLTRIFGTLSLGELAVDGFFLISGYLVVKSALESRSAVEFLFKRILRIYPGYVVAYAICIAISPFVGGALAGLTGASVLSAIVFLFPPEVPGAFPGTPYPMLNGSMWTIAYEFRCYLLALLAWSIGLTSKRVAALCLTAGLVALSAVRADIWGWFPERLTTLLGSPEIGASFVAVFACGALFYLYRDRVVYDGRIAAVAAAALLVLLFSPHLATAAVAVLGGYVLFWFAFAARYRRLAAVGSKTDLSYGVYLYAWPVQKLMILAAPGISPYLLFVVATAIAGCLAFASWRLVEKPFLRLKTTFADARPIAAEQIGVVER